MEEIRTLGKNMSNLRLKTDICSRCYKTGDCVKNFY